MTEAGDGTPVPINIGEDEYQGVEIGGGGSSTVYQVSGFGEENLAIKVLRVGKSRDILEHEHRVISYLRDQRGLNAVLIESLGVFDGTIAGEGVEILKQRLAPGQRLDKFFQNPELEIGELLTTMSGVAYAYDQINGQNAFDPDASPSSVFVDTETKSPENTVLIDAGEYLVFDDVGNPYLIPARDDIALTPEHSSPMAQMAGGTTQELVEMGTDRLRKVQQWSCMSIIFQRMFRQTEFRAFPEVIGKFSSKRDSGLVINEIDEQTGDILVNPAYYGALMHTLDTFPEEIRQPASLAGLLWVDEQIAANPDKFRILSGLSKDQVGAIYGFFRLAMSSLLKEEFARRNGEEALLDASDEQLEGAGFLSDTLVKSPEDAERVFVDQILPQLMLIERIRQVPPEQRPLPDEVDEAKEAIIKIVEAWGEVDDTEISVETARVILRNDIFNLEFLVSLLKANVEPRDTEAYIDELNKLWHMVFNAHRELYFETNVEFVDSLTRYLAPSEVGNRD